MNISISGAVKGLPTGPKNRLCPTRPVVFSQLTKINYIFGTSFSLLFSNSSVMACMTPERQIVNGEPVSEELPICDIHVSLMTVVKPTLKRLEINYLCYSAPHPLYL